MSFFPKYQKELTDKLLFHSYMHYVKVYKQLCQCGYLSFAIFFSSLFHCGGRQIALESVCVIDNGETMLVEGLRVAPQERGKGVAGVLLRFCSELVKSKYPEVKVTRLTRDDQLGPKDFQKYRIITKQVPAAKAKFFFFIFL